MSVKSLLVTGGAGYIGSHFIMEAMANYPDLNILVVDDLRTGHKTALSPFSRVSFCQLDLCSTDELGRLMGKHGIEAVVHFAASCYVGESQSTPGKYWINNVSNSISLFAAMERAGVSKIVFSSSCAVYGVPDTVQITEDTTRQPINVYGLTKKTTEDILQSYCERLGWGAICLRYFNAAGASLDGRIGESHDPETHVIPLLLQAASGKRPAFEILGNDYETRDGTCIRDYIHVNDLARGHIQALEYLQKSNGFFGINLGSQMGTSVMELIGLCEQFTGRRLPSHVVPRRPGDPPQLVASAKKARNLLGWTPELDIEQIIRTAWAWEQNRQY